MVQSLEVGLGERRITNFAGVGISVGEELDISAVMGVHIWSHDVLARALTSG